jgi:hypothetical protein
VPFSRGFRVEFSPGPAARALLAELAMRTRACLVAAGVTLSACPASAADGESWSLALDGALGPRFEARQRPPQSFAPARNDVGRASSMGLRFGPVVADGLTLYGVGRFPVPMEGEAAIGAGANVELPLGRPALRPFGALELGYKALFNDACECGGLTYAVPWARVEAGVRYRVIAALEPGTVRRRGALHDFDIALTASIGLDGVLATYPDGAQYGRHVDDHGLRWGVDPSLGAGFVW